MCWIYVWDEHGSVPTKRSHTYLFLQIKIFLTEKNSKCVPASYWNFKSCKSCYEWLAVASIHKFISQASCPGNQINWSQLWKISQVWWPFLQDIGTDWYRLDRSEGLCIILSMSQTMMAVWPWCCWWKNNNVLRFSYCWQLDIQWWLTFWMF